MKYGQMYMSRLRNLSLYSVQKYDKYSEKTLFSNE